ncbi:hypothetical protein [Prosthecobacter sp.]|uniref:hypothetical protein n=1 Tax=Prosthecobacter sp. TaxID=1965333 RepID=UPI0037848652
MSDDSRSPKDKSSAGLVALIMALPLCYVLSIGPAGYLLEKFHAPPTWRPYVLTVYKPVIWLHDNTSLKEPIEVYVRWWSDLTRR